MIILDRIYEYAYNAIELGEHRLIGRGLLLAELRSIRNALEPYVGDTKKAEIKKKAQSLIETMEASSGK